MSGRDERLRRRVLKTHPHKIKVDKAAFMIRKGLTDDEIVDYFRMFEDYSEVETRNHLDRIRPFIENN